MKPDKLSDLMIIKLNQSNVEEFMQKNNVSIKYTPEDIKNAIGVETRSRARVGSVFDSESSGESDVESDVESSGDEANVIDV